MLMTLRKNLNETIDVVNQMSSIVENIDDNFTDIYSQIQSLNNQIIQINTNFVTFENRINNNVQQQLVQFNSQILSLMNDYQTIFNQNLATLQENLETQIEEIELGNVIAYNPTTRNL